MGKLLEIACRVVRMLYILLYMQTEGFSIGVFFYGVGIVGFPGDLICISCMNVDAVRVGSCVCVCGLCVYNSRMPFVSSAYLVEVSVVDL